MNLFTMATQSLVFACCLSGACAAFGTGAPVDEKRTADSDGWVPLFAEKGEPKGWVVTHWSDLSKPAPVGAKWEVDEQGVLHGSDPRGTWLVSEREYGDFELEFEWKLGEQGNGGCALRTPMKGDPAFDGLEVQMVDERYNNGQDGPDKLTGSLYKALASAKQVYKPTEWNRYSITLAGSHIKIVLNVTVIQDVDLDEQTRPVERHDGSHAPTLKDRPRKGHIGFQELSRGGGHVQIRNARIRVPDDTMQ